MLSCSGGTAEKRYKGTAGDSLASPDVCSGGHEVTGLSRQQPAAPDKVQNYRERLPSVAAGGWGFKQGGISYLLTESLSTTYIFFWPLVATTGQTPGSVAFACWRFIRLLEYLDEAR